MNDQERQHPLSVRSRYRPRRSSSASRQTVIQIRASNLVKKLGIFTSKIGAGTFLKPDSSKQISTSSDADSKNYPCRKTRSLDVLRATPYMSSPMLAVNFKSQDLARHSADGSHESGSDIGNETVTVHTHRKKSSVAQGLAVAAMVAEASLRPPEASPDTRPNFVLNSSGAVGNASHQNREQLRSLAPPLPEKRPGHPRLSTLPPLNFNLKGMSQDQRPTRFSPSVIVRPPPFPILELPALPTPIAETEVSGRQNHSRTRRGTPRLNSMPMLPMEGADERENDPDHENYGLDDDEEGDDDDNADEGPAEAADSEDEDEDADCNGRSSRRSHSSTVNPSPTGSLFSRTHALFPRLQLPELNSPSLSSLLGAGFGGSDSSPASVTVGHAGSALPGDAETARDTTTPKAEKPSQVRNGYVGTDYFSAASDSSGPGAAELRAKYIYPSRGEGESSAPSSSASSSTHPQLPQPLSSSSSALRTPTARDYPTSQPPMISVAPPLTPLTQSEAGTSGSDVHTLKDSLTPKGSQLNVPHLIALDLPKRRPSIYHHASKSMVELFPTTTASNGGVDVSAIGDGTADHAIKGKGKLLPDESASNIQTLKTSPSKGTAAKDQTDTKALFPTGVGTNAKAVEKTLPTMPTTAAPKESATSLRRQRSMPTFSTSGPPPPYPSFPLPVHLRRFAPLPREDEGKEELPLYSNAIKLVAIMPRKVEFNAPGVPARDRKWRRVHCVLVGTAFRIYDAPPRVSGVSTLGGWWERKVGVGDVSAGQGTATTAAPGATTNIVLGRKEPKRRMKWEEELQAEEVSQRMDTRAEEAQPSTVEVNVSAQSQGHKSKRNLAASLLHPHRARNSLANGSLSSPSSPRSSFQSQRTSVESSAPPSARPSVDISTPISSSSALTSSSRSTSSASLSGLSTDTSGLPPSEPTRRYGHMRSDSAPSSTAHSRSNSRAHSLLNPDSQSCQNQVSNSSGFRGQSSPLLPEPDEKDLMRVYSLQRAESGLASDYTKRKNVVRVRMEGEQFLLQCKDVASVVEWIEGLQAATNIALDLDERPMPKGPIFPRRRRRRRIQRGEAGTEQSTAETGMNETGTS